MQALEQFRTRKTPFGDTPTPIESRYARTDFIAHERPDAVPDSRYEIFSLQPALDGLGGGSDASAPRTRR